MKKIFLVMGMSVITMLFASLNVFAVESKPLDPPGPGVVAPGEDIVIGGTFTLTGPPPPPRLPRGSDDPGGGRAGREVCE